MVLRSIFIKCIFLIVLPVCAASATAKQGQVSKLPRQCDAVDADTLAARAKACFDAGKYHQADSLYARALALKKENFAEETPEYTDILCGYVEMCLEFDKLEGLREKLEMIMNVRKKTFGDNSLQYVQILNLYGRYLVLKADFGAAEQALSAAAPVGKKCVDSEAAPYIRTLLTLATLHLYKQDFDAGGRYSMEALELSRSVGDELNEGMAMVCLGSYHAYTGDINKAMEFFIEALHLLKKTCGEEHPAYMGTLTNCASLYGVRGSYAEAEKMIRKAMELSKNIFGEEHIQYFSALSVLASIYTQQYKFEESEKLQLKSLELRKKIYGETNPTVVTALIQLGQVYQLLGNYKRVEQMCRQAMDIISLTPYAFKTLKATVVHLLGKAYLEQGRFAEALETFRLALAEQEANNLSDDYLSFSIASDICTALLRDKNKPLAELEVEYVHQLKLIEERYGQQSIHYLFTRKNLATVYLYKGEYEKALAIYKEVMRGYLDRGAELSWHYVNIVWNIAQTLNMMGLIDDSLVRHEQCLEVIRELTVRDFFFLSEQEREKYWQAQNFHLKRFIAFGAGNYLQTGDERLTAFAYDSELFAKNLLLSSAVAMQEAVYKTGNPGLVAKWQQVKQLRNTSHNEEARLLERELISSLKAVGVSDEFSTKWQDVRRMLAPGEAAIEFINCRLKGTDGELRIYNYALMIRAHSEYPELILHFDEESMKKILAESEGGITPSYNLIWEVLTPYLDDINTLYVAPSGLFNTVSFAVFRNPDRGGYVTDKYTIHHLLSTRDIGTLKASARSGGRKKDIVLFGGADFGLPPGALAFDGGDKADKPSPLVRGTVDNLLKKRGQGFDFLPGSLAEVRAIEKITSEAGWDVSLFTDDEATEARLKSLSGRSPEVLHISTHGFYYSPPVRSAPPTDVQLEYNAFSGAVEPMMRSGLLLAGANNSWTDKEPVDTANDGVLTAYEIANLDLTHTELVVLSACNTGLGDIDYSEGIYGLQRAFRLAGVRTMILSLWKVPDEETCALMSAFYAGWMSGLTVKQAFEKAQKGLRDRYPDEPLKWGGFLLIE